MGNRQSGQAMVETLITSAIALAAFTFTMMLLYRSLLYFGSRHSMNELLLCTASLQPLAVCEEQFKRKTDSFLIFKESAQLKVKKSSYQIVATFKVKSLGTPSLLIERKILLPLRRNK